MRIYIHLWKALYQNQIFGLGIRNASPLVIVSGHSYVIDLVSGSLKVTVPPGGLVLCSSPSSPSAPLHLVSPSPVVFVCVINADVPKLAPHTTYVVHLTWTRRWVKSCVACKQWGIWCSKMWRRKAWWDTLLVGPVSLTVPVLIWL